MIEPSEEVNFQGNATEHGVVDPVVLQHLLLANVLDNKVLSVGQPHCHLHKAERALSNRVDCLVMVVKGPSAQLLLVASGKKQAMATQHRRPRRVEITLRERTKPLPTVVAPFVSIFIVFVIPRLSPLRYPLGRVLLSVGKQYTRNSANACVRCCCCCRRRLNVTRNPRAKKGCPGVRGHTLHLKHNRNELSVLVARLRAIVALCNGIVVQPTYAASEKRRFRRVSVVVVMVTKGVRCGPRAVRGRRSQRGRLRHKTRRTAYCRVAVAANARVKVQIHHFQFPALLFRAFGAVHLRVWSSLDARYSVVAVLRRIEVAVVALAETSLEIGKEKAHVTADEIRLCVPEHEAREVVIARLDDAIAVKGDHSAQVGIHLNGDADGAVAAVHTRRDHTDGKHEAIFGLPGETLLLANAPLRVLCIRHNDGRKQVGDGDGVYFVRCVTKQLCK
eukprot:Opistho-2@8335